MNIIHTERLLLRPYEATDFSHIFRLQSDAETMHYIRPATTEVAIVLERTQLWLKYAAENPGYGVLTLESLADRSFIGYTVVRHVEFKPGGEIELGYTLAKESWGNGYATEATEGMMQYAIKTLGVSALVAYTDEMNHASNRVLEKCGFTRKGMERMYDADCLRWEWR